MNTTGSPCNIPELFGCMVFNESTMQQRLSPTVYAAWKQCIADGTPLDPTIAHSIANAMKDWAIERGAWSPRYARQFVADAEARIARGDALL